MLKGLVTAVGSDDETEMPEDVVLRAGFASGPVDAFVVDTKAGAGQLRNFLVNNKRRWREHLLDPPKVTKAGLPRPEKKPADTATRPKT